MKQIVSLLLLGCSFCSSLLGANPIDVFVNDPLLRNATVSLLVKDLNNGRELYSFRPNCATIPASTLKVITTATALELLGPDYRYETTLEYDGYISADSVLHGNLYIHGSGDPTLGSEKMGNPLFIADWVTAVKRAGINRINGNVVADGSRFDDEGVNPKWTWDDIGNYYAPGIYGISYLDNMMRVELNSGAVGTTPKVMSVSPEIPGLVLENKLTSTKISFDSAYFYGAPKSLFRSVYGQIPASRSSFIIKGELPNSGLLLAMHFHERMCVNGIVITGLPTDKPTATIVRKPIYTHFSPPLSQLISEINVKSNNHYAEQLFRSIALTQHSIATTNAAIALIRSFWKSKGLPVEQLFQLDGSGLSPTNAVSARFFVELMRYMHTDSKNKDYFVNSMAVSGESGTLKGMFVNSPLKGKVKAKSGTIARVKCYVGYIQLKGRTLAFAVLVNNADGSSSQITKKIEQFLVAASK